MKDQVTANAVVFPITEFLVCGASGFTINATIVVAYTKGTNDNILVRKYIKKVFLMASLANLITVIAMMPLVPKLLSLYHLSDVSFGIALEIIVMQAIMLIIIFPSGFLLSAGFRGTGDVVATTAASMAIIWCVRLPVAFLFAYVLQMGAMENG